MAEDSGATAAEVAEDSSSEDEFQERMAAKAAEQNLGEGAVPEQRPQAFATDAGPPHSELTQKLIDAGEVNVEPMGKEAYDKADSKSQARKAARNSFSEGFLPGDVAKCANEDSPHFGRVFAVTRVLGHRGVDEGIRSAQGDPTQLWDTPIELEGRAIGDERDGELLVLNVDELQLEKVRDYRGTGRR